MNYQKFDLNGLAYLIRYPEDFNPREQYPALLFLHGAGSRGSDMANLISNPFFAEISGHKDFPFVVIAPLCSENTWFEMWERLMALVKLAAALTYVKADQFYMMGASMGGYGTWQLAMSLPEYFAAIVPICGGGMFWNAPRLVNVPAWAFHGGKDPGIPMEESRKMVDAVNAAGGKATLTIYPENDHNAWSDTYRNPEVFSWLLQHRNAKSAPQGDSYNNAQQYG